MDSPNRPGQKSPTSSELPENREQRPSVPVFVRDKWPTPCAARGEQAPGISLYLTLHCPKCGQLANLDDDFTKQICLLEERGLEQLLLSGNHHEFEQ